MKISLKSSINLTTDAGAVNAYAIGGGEANLFVACSNKEVEQNIVDQLAARCGEKSSLSPLDAGEALDHALRIDNQRVKCNLSLLLVHTGGALAMQMGEGRVFQVRRKRAEVLYDSRNQVLDIYSTNAKVAQLTDVKAGDTLVVTAAGRFLVDDVARLLCDKEMTTDDRVTAISNRLHAPLTALTVDEVSGRTATVTDMGRRWWRITAWLVAAVAVAAAVALFYHPAPTPDGDDAPAQDPAPEAQAPAPATAAPADEAPIIHEAPAAEDLRRDEPRRDEPRDNRRSENKEKDKHPADSEGEHPAAEHPAEPAPPAAATPPPPAQPEAPAPAPAPSGDPE